MRNLVLMRGSAGCGKSTWIKDNGLDQYTLAADDIRLLFQSPVLNVDGDLEISQKNDHKVWDLLFDLLEKRMERGEFTVVDATHSRAQLINRYKPLAQKYRYRVYVVDFTHVPEEEVVRRNFMRPAYKQVPASAISTMVARLQTQPTPNWVTTIHPDHFWPLFGGLRLFDFNKWDRIHHIGDIHGCFEPLRQYFATFGYNPNEFYIFVGDYLDRGVQNVEVIEYLLPLAGQPNVLFLEGNHEIHLRNYAHDEPVYSREFAGVTARQLDRLGVDKSKLREFCRRMGQLAWYEYRGQKVLVTHGGLPVVPTAFTSTQEIIKGVGKYEDAEQVAEAFQKNTAGDTYQIHGHRNMGADLPIQNGRVFNLCDTVEFGGHLRAVILDRDGFHPVSIPNPVYALEEESVEPEAAPVVDLISALRSNQYVEERKLTDSISSFNFSRQAFRRKKWDAQTVKARGLFVNVNTGDIVARAYEKFFNMNETESTKENVLRRTMRFPAVAYRKENGFLGIVGYDAESDQMIVTTKTTMYGPHTGWFCDILERTTNMEALKAFVKEEGVSLIFEVVDPVNDPHIIHYDAPALYLLDVVARSLEYTRFTYPDLRRTAARFGFQVKKVSYTFHTWDEFSSFYRMFSGNYEFTDDSSPVEGYVVECADGFMFKLKSEYYQVYKQMRGIKDRLAKRQQVNTAMIWSPVATRFYGWLAQQPREELAGKSIIDLREAWGRA
jgi:predicted kinase